MFTCVVRRGLLRGGESQEGPTSRRQRIASLTPRPPMTIGGEEVWGGVSLKGTGGFLSEIVAECACEGGKV